jgi:hypothetical protein
MDVWRVERLGFESQTKVKALLEDRVGFIKAYPNDEYDELCLVPALKSTPQSWWDEASGS